MADVPIDSEDVNAVTFTGSVSAGGKVAQRATSQIKKCVLELGGSDPFIVYSRMLTLKKHQVVLSKVGSLIMVRVV